MENFKIKNEAGVTTIDIEGVIGVPEAWQFDNEDDRVATYEKFTSLIKEVSDINAPIIVNIRSTGGDVNDALLIYDALLSTGSQITTRCYGYVASAATIIAQAASPGRREISPNALYLIHRAHASAEGNAEQLSARVDLLKKTDEQLSNIYAMRSNKDASIFVDLMAEQNGEGRWLDPNEVIEYGLADQIMKTYNVKNMSSENVKPSVVKTILNKLGLNALADAEEQYATVKTVDGKELSFDGEIKEGAIASEDGTFTLEDGRVVVIQDGAVTEVKNPTDEAAALKDQNQSLEAEKQALEGEKAQLEQQVAQKDVEISNLKKLVKTDQEQAIINRVNELGGIEELPASNYKPKVAPEVNNNTVALSKHERVISELRAKNAARREELKQQLKL